MSPYGSVFLICQPSVDLMTWLKGLGVTSNEASQLVSLCQVSCWAAHRRVTNPSDFYMFVACLPLQDYSQPSPRPSGYHAHADPPVTPRKCTPRASPTHAVRPIDAVTSANTFCALASNGLLASYIYMYHLCLCAAACISRVTVQLWQEPQEPRIRKQTRRQQRAPLVLIVIQPQR